MNVRLTEQEARILQQIHDNPTKGHMFVGASYDKKNNLVRKGLLLDHTGFEFELTTLGVEALNEYRKANTQDDQRGEVKDSEGSNRSIET